MLLHSFFALVAPPEVTATSVQARVRLHAGHPIFAGHFPGQPVVPGVCMLQLVKELLEGAVQRRVQLTQAGNVKFLAVLTPAAHEIVGVQLKFDSSAEGIVLSEATISAGSERFLRLQQAHYAFRSSEPTPPATGALRPPQAVRGSADV